MENGAGNRAFFFKTWALPADRDCMRSQLRPRVLLPTAVLALMGIGVGAFAFSGTPGGDVATPTLKRPVAKSAAAGVTRSAWAKQANQICAALNADTAALGNPTGREKMLEVLPTGLDLADTALVSLRAVPAPAPDQPRITKMLALFGGFVKTERQAVEALRSGNTVTFVRLNGRAFALNNKGNVIARDLGAGQCAEGGSENSDLTRALERNPVVVAVLYSPDSTVDKLAIREARAGAKAAKVGFVAIDVYNTREVAPVAAESEVRGAPAVLVFARYEGAVTQIAGWVDRETVAQAADNAAV
jgi:hypothetical protein